MGGFRQELNQDSVIQSLADEGTVCRKSSNLYSLMFLGGLVPPLICDWLGKSVSFQKYGLPKLWDNRVVTK